MQVLVVSLMLTFTFIGVSQCQSNCSYLDLQKNLEEFYTIPVRPTKDWEHPTAVNVDLSLYAIVNVDMNLQILTTYVMFQVEWDNEFVNWDPETYCEITNLTIPDMDFWKPDIYIYELIESSQTDDHPIAIPYYILTYTGQVIQWKPVRLVSTCNLQVFKFPFDVQICSLTLGSFVYSAEELIMVPRHNSLNVTTQSQEQFVRKGDWDLLNINVYTKEDEYGNGTIFTLVVYEISIRRSPLNYVINLVIPAILMVIVDIFSMFIPSYEERLSFKITVVLGFSVLLLILNDMLPNSSSPPILGVFCCVCMSMMIFSIAGCVITSYMVELSSKKAEFPRWIDTYLLHYLACVFCVKAVDKDLEPLVLKNIGCHDDNKTDITLRLHKKNYQKVRMNPELKLLKGILEELARLHEQRNTPINTDNVAESKWYTAAVVLDRLILIMYIITVIIIFIIMIISWA